MSNHLTALEIDSSGLVDRDDHKRCVGHDGQECGIDGAEVAIVAAADHTDIGVAALLPRGQTVHVPELGGPHSAEP